MMLMQSAHLITQQVSSVELFLDCNSDQAGCFQPPLIWHSFSIFSIRNPRLINRTAVQAEGQRFINTLRSLQFLTSGVVLHSLSVVKHIMYPHGVSLTQKTCREGNKAVATICTLWFSQSREAAHHIWRFQAPTAPPSNDVRDPFRSCTGATFIKPDRSMIFVRRRKQEDKSTRKCFKTLTLRVA